MYEESKWLHRIEQMAKGCSVHARAANRYWLALIVASIAVMTLGSGAGNGLSFDIGQVTLSAGQAVERINLPFGLGTVNRMGFYLISLLILSGLAIAYTSAHIQVTMDKNKIERMRLELFEEECRSGLPNNLMDSPHIGDIVTSIIEPNYNKVSSIPNYMFHGRRDSVGYALVYILLKVFSWLFTYGIPLLSIVLCTVRLWRIDSMLCGSGFWDAVAKSGLTLIAAVGAFSIIVMVCVDVKWTRNSIGKCR